MFAELSGLALWLQSSGGGLPGLVMFLPLLALIVYMLYSQQRRQKKWQAQLGELKAGDRVTTSGGLRGTIVGLKDDALTLRVPPDNLRLEIARSAVMQVVAPEEAK